MFHAKIALGRNKNAMGESGEAGGGWAEGITLVFVTTFHSAFS